jgi:hypothetical protein
VTLTIGRSLHEITGITVVEMYDFNISSANRLEYDDLVAKTLNLSRRIDSWRKSCSPFQVPLKDPNSRVSVSSNFGPEKYEVLLSIHYYRAILLVNEPLLIGALERSAPSNGHSPGILQDVATSLLIRDFAAAKELSEILSCIVRFDFAFLRRNAIWWICNYGGEFY